MKKILILLSLASCDLGKSDYVPSPPPITKGKCKGLMFIGEMRTSSRCIFEGYMWSCINDYTCVRGVQTTAEDAL